MKPRFIVEQAITAFVNKYRIYSVNEDGSKGNLCAYVQQKRFSIKEKVIFYADEKKTTQLFSFRAEKVIDIHGRYLIEDTNGKHIGTFKKEFAKSLISSTWHILDNTDKPSLIVSESNNALAVLRRYIGFVPIFGDILDLLMVFFKYHFSFKTPDGTVVGMYKKTTLFRDHYMLLMDDTIYSQNDWRILAAMTVALDALQSR